MTKKTEKPTLKKNGGKRLGAGRKAFQPSDQQREQVTAMSGYGVPQDQIAALIGISYETLHKYFKDELIRGKAKANYKVGKTLWSQATNGNTAAAIWWSKSQMGWKDSTKVELTGENGGAISHEFILQIDPISTKKGDGGDSGDNGKR